MHIILVKLILLAIITLSMRLVSKRKIISGSSQLIKTHGGFKLYNKSYKNSKSS